MHTRLRSSVRSILVRSLASSLAFTSTYAVAQGTANEQTMRKLTVSDDGLEELSLTKKNDSGSRLGLTVIETPASVEIIDGDRIREMGDVSVLDALVRLVGFTDASGPGNGGTAITARGFTGHGSVMQLYDGSRFYVGAGTLTFPFDTWSIDRIEVLHGPASVLHGEGALGGAVNVIPKKPSRKTNAQMRVAVDSQDSLRLGAGGGGPLGDVVSYRADFSRNQSKGWLRQNGESYSTAITAALRADLTDSLAITLAHDYGDQEPERYFGVPLVNGRPVEAWRYNNYNVDDSAIHYRDNATRLKIDWYLGENVSLTNEAYYLVSDRHWRNAESYFYNQGTNLVTRVEGNFLEIRHDQTQRGNRFNVVVDHSLFGLGNKLSVGFDVNRIEFTHINNAPYGGTSVTTADYPTPSNFINQAGTFPKYQTQSTQTSVFMEDRLEITDRWSVVGGLRYDDIEVERTDFFNAANNFSKGFTPTNWRLGTVFTFTPAFVVYGQYATNASHLGSLITMASNQTGYDLSTSEQFEVGVKQSAEFGEWTLAVYDITKRKILARNPDRPTETLQIGAQSSRGVELNASFKLFDSWRVGFNTAVLDAQYDEFLEQVTTGVYASRNGNTPNGVPERIYNVFTSWDATSDLRAGAAWRYVGMRYSNTANTVEAPSYNVLDATLRWKVNESLSVTARVDNVFDKLYSVSSSSSQWRLGDPRTFTLWADFGFK